MADKERPEDKTICFQLHVKRPGLRRKADMDRIDAGNADKDMLIVSKQIIDSDEYRRINRHVRYMKAYVQAIGLPSPVLKGGVYQIPLERVENVVNEVDRMRQEFFVLVDELVVAYPPLKQVARERLGTDQYDEEDYPSIEKLRSGFDIQTTFIETATPERLRHISPALFKAYKEEHEKKWEHMTDVYDQLLKTEMKGLVDKMVSMLGTSEDGRKKGFQKVNVKKLSEFLQEAPFRNVASDEDLSKVVSIAGKLLDNVDPEIAKADDDYREKLRGSFEVLQGRLATMVEEKQRLISFDEEV